MVQTIRIGVRPSLLAFEQAKEIQQRLPHVAMEIVQIKTSGDRDKTTLLIAQENTSFFTDEIESALLNGSVDVAIHSAKDLEEDAPEQLVVVAMTKSVSPYDCLVSRENQTLDQLSAGSRVGTSSQARKEGILKYRSDLVVKDIRGNVDDRLKQLDRGEFEAIIVADAALIRLGLKDRVAQLIPKEIIQPHPLQGRLAIQIRKDRNDLKEAFQKLDSC